MGSAGAGADAAEAISAAASAAVVLVGSSSCAGGGGGGISMASLNAFDGVGSCFSSGFGAGFSAGASTAVQKEEPYQHFMDLAFASSKPFLGGAGAGLGFSTGTHSFSLFLCTDPLDTGNCMRSVACCCCLSAKLVTGICLASCSQTKTTRHQHV